jgi:glycosyltransferase involved in cell wall biosynthesis
MAGKQRNVSVIICTYTEKRWENLVAAVESVQQQSMPPREIIVVVDNNAHLLERVRAQMPGIIAIENSQQRGSSGSRNSGIAIAQGALLAFLDDDAIAFPDWLERISQGCADPQVLGASGMVEPLWAARKPAWFPEEFYWVLGCSYRGLSGQGGKHSQPAKGATFEGCACFRREVFEAVGGFRNDMGRVESFPPAGGEGAELCIRARLRWPEKVFLFEQEARILHLVPSFRASWRYFCSRCVAEGRSKAVLARYARQAGARNTLSTERAYVTQTLPRGVLRGIGDAFTRLDGSGLLRAGAIIAGLVLTTTGFLSARITQLLRGERARAGNQAMSVTVVRQAHVGAGAGASDTPAAASPAPILYKSDTRAEAIR